MTPRDRSNERLQKPIIGITSGDPSGVGPEVVVKALMNPGVRECCRVLILGDARVFDRMTLASDLTRDEIRDGSGAPGSVPIWEMPGFIARLEAAGFAATAHRLFLQMELAKPLFLAAMVLAGAAFLLRPARFGRTGAMVLAAVLTGAGLFFLRNFARVMGEAGDIPVAAAAWAPPTAALLIGVWLMLTFEDA